MVRINTREEVTRQVDENMLKAMHLIKMRRGVVHVADLAEEFGMAITTAYSAVGRLCNSGYIQPLEAHRGGRNSNKQPIAFTPEGAELAKKIADRHQMIMGWLIKLGIPAEEADREACHMEHGITDTTIEAIRNHVEQMTKRFGMNACNACHKISLEEKAQIAALIEVNREKYSPTLREKLEIVIEQAGGLEGIERKTALVNRAGGADNLAFLLDVVEALGGSEYLHKEKDELLALKRQIELRGGAQALERSFSLIDEVGGVDRIKRTQAERKALEEKAEVLRAENETLLRKAGDLRNENADFSNKIEALQAELCSRKKEWEESAKQLDEARKELEMLRETVEGLEGPATIRRIKTTAKEFGSVGKMLSFVKQTRRLWTKFWLEE